MKKVILIAAIILLPIIASAQAPSMKAFYDKYSGRDGFTTVVMSGAMLKMATGVEQSSDGNILNSIDNIVIIVADEASEEFTRDVKRLNESSDYTDLSVIRDGSQTIKFMTVKKDGKTSEFLMTVIEEDGGVVMSFRGDDIDVTSVTKMAKISVSN